MFPNSRPVTNLHQIVNLPWFLVARMDTSEVYAPLYARLWETLLFFGALILAGGAGLVS